ncbi:MAG: type I restriction enzyme HsdR N-terminal domain-containing protein [Chitinophagaceae bacterium]|nr:type I restriction enzyme HsdR N-terminal domain-containing protein [Chitinophagaceae bacterium]
MVDLEGISSLLYQKRNNTLFVFDIIRKKYRVATPEEIVRQYFIRFLIEKRNVSQALINIERGLYYNTLLKRVDIIVYNRKGVPWMLVECKRHDIDMKIDALYQNTTYNSVFHAPFLVVTNLKSTLVFETFENKTFERTEIPFFDLS